MTGKKRVDPILRGFIEVTSLVTVWIVLFDPAIATLMGVETLNVVFEAVGESVSEPKDVDDISGTEKFILEFAIILKILRH